MIGAPAPEEVLHIRGAQAREFLQRMEGKRRVPFTEVFPDADDDAASLLEEMLLFDPDRRCTSEQALSHSFFAGFRYVAGGVA